MKKKMSILSIAAATLIGSVSIAAPFDLNNIVDSEKNYTFNKFLGSKDAFDYVSKNMGEYLIESSDGKYYKVSDVDKAINEGAKDFAEAIEGLEPVEKPEESELKVESVSAITETVFKGDLVEFTINNGQKVTLEELKEEGYGIQFLTDNQDSLDINTGEVKVEARTSFTYVVAITPEEGEAIYSNEQKVTVIDKEGIKTIKKVALFDKSEEEVHTITKDHDGNLTIKILEYVQVDGKEIEAKRDVKNFKVTSSNRSVLNTNSEKELMVGNAGTTTITLEKDGVDTYEFDVTVVEDEPVATTAEAEDVKLNSKLHKDNAKEVKVVIKDQYGNEMAEDYKLEAVKQGKDAVVKVDGKKLYVADNVENGTDTVNITVEKDGKDVRIGSFKVSVERAGVEVTQELVLDGEKTLDLKDEEELKVKLVGKDREGVVTKNYAITSIEGIEGIVTTDLEEGSSKEEVTLTANKSGKATLTIKSGDISKDLKIEVVDSTPVTIKAIDGNNVTEENKNEITITLDEKLPKIELTDGVTVKGATLNGKNVEESILYDIEGLTGLKFTSNPVKEINLNVNASKDKLEAFGIKDKSVIKIKVENGAGIESTFTINFVEAE